MPPPNGRFLKNRPIFLENTAIIWYNTSQIEKYDMPIKINPGGTKISVTNLFFYQSESCVNLSLKFLCGLSVIRGKKCINQDIGILPDYSRPQSASDQTQATSDELNMPNEPNLCNTNPINNSLMYSFTHLLINSIMPNEPNFAQRTSSIKYPESRFEQLLSNEPNLSRGKVTHFINEQRTMPALPALPALSIVEGSKIEGSSAEGNNEQLSNEPNLKITKINVSSFITKYYENICPCDAGKTNPICGKRTQFCPKQTQLDAVVGYFFSSSSSQSL